MKAFTVIAPFATRPAVTITAPAPVRELVAALGLRINLRTGTATLTRRKALQMAVDKVAGKRRVGESYEAYAARATNALREVVMGA